MMIKLKSTLIALSVFLVLGSVLEGRVFADPDTQTTTTGAVFTRISSIGDFAKLNEAWKDPSGLIWGDTVKKADGTIDVMIHTHAADYCAKIGTRLPSWEEFTSLREYMGAEQGTWKGYSAQILPNLYGNRFWSSTKDPDPESSGSYAQSFTFDGKTGGIRTERHYFSRAVRCVISP